MFTRIWWEDSFSTSCLPSCLGLSFLASISWPINGWLLDYHVGLYFLLMILTCTKNNRKMIRFKGWKTKMRGRLEEKCGVEDQKTKQESHVFSTTRQKGSFYKLAPECDGRWKCQLFLNAKDQQPLYLRSQFSSSGLYCTCCLWHFLILQFPLAKSSQIQP